MHVLCCAGLVAAFAARSISISVLLILRFAGNPMLVQKGSDGPVEWLEMNMSE